MRRAVAFAAFAGVAALAAMFAAPPARAQLVGCVFISNSGLAFGSYNVFSATPLAITGTITYQCGLLISNPITIFLDTGTNGGTYSGGRFMLNSADGDKLNYNVYLDAAHTQIWGNGTGGSTDYSANPPLLTNVTVNMYGLVPAAQDLSVGSYSDTLTATINF